MRLAQWFAARTEEPARVPPSSNPDILRFTTPARGDAYEFGISLRCEWQLTTARVWPGESGIRPGQIAALDQARTEIRPRLQDITRAVAREFAPDKPAEAERALAEKLATGLQANGLPCRAVACVSLPDEILPQLRSHWQEQLAYELRADRSEVLAKQAGRLRQSWQTFLLDSLNPEPGPSGEDVGWLVPEALELAEHPQELAAKVRAMAGQRQDQAAGLGSDLAWMLNRSNDLDVLTFLLDTDSALRETLLRLGISLPPLPAGSALSEARAASSR